MTMVDFDIKQKHSEFAYSTSHPRILNHARIQGFDMHSSSSSSSLRPRQRTFTSCTECRRRKQRCNQAKDRPCNNCSRRYPPVVCTYESSSPPPTHDHLVDLRDGGSYATQTTTQTQQGYVPSQNQSQYPSSSSASVMSDQSSNYYPTTTGYYAPASTTTSRYPSSGGNASASQYIATTSGYGVADTGYYQNDYSAPVTSGGYYASTSGAWLASNGDPTAFVGVGEGDYYYIPEPDENNSGRR